jgi:ribosome recycling factor
MISIQVWDKSLVSKVERAIRDAGLGLNPAADGTLVRVGIPELNEERRKELAKVANKYAEAARVAARHVRRDGMDALKKAEKDGTMSQDDARSMSDEVQKITDAVIVEIDQLLASKEQEIMQV